MSPTCDVGKPSKASYNQSHSPTVKKLALDTFYRKKSASGAGSSDLQEIKIKKNRDSKRFNYSGELQTTSRLSPFRCSRGSDISPCQSKTPQSPLRAIRFLGSSKEPENNKIDRLKFSSQGSGNLEEVLSQKSKKGSNSVSISESKRFNHSGNLQTPGRSSSLQCSRSTGVSPIQSGRPQSAFGGGRLLVGSREDENNFADRTTFFSRSSGNLQQVLSREEKRSLNPIIPAIEKTVYIDTVEISSSKSSSAIKGKMDFESEECTGALQEKRVTEETSTEILCQDTKPTDSSKGSGILEPEVSDSIYSHLSTFSEILNLRFQNETTKGCKLENGNNDLQFSSEHMKEIADRNSNVISDQIKLADDSGNVIADSLQSPAPPPLPKSPSESWLWRTLPLVSLRNSFLSSSNGGSQSHTKKKGSSMTCTHTKWETIVKSSKLHHDHVRYSEELTSHVSQHSKT
ncbi:DUF688 family protein [Quillaja saponaria]|uniref:DUF688 family protein n=1 Tax=Quillaja saponaria TaxID=32244 RepID=A0AAD7PUS5_QUISA|nr:DUF688 family protein [Quillaja saponaria]